MYKIRLFEPTDSDYASAVEVFNTVWPDEANVVENWKHSDEQRNPKFLFQRFVAENDQGTIVAEGACWESAWSYVPGKYGLGFNIHPDHEDQSLDRQMYDYVFAFLQERDPKPVYLVTHMREDKEDRIAFLTNLGFKDIMRDNSSEVDLAGYDYAPYEGLTEKVVASGIELTTLPELQARDKDWMQRYYDLENIIDRDVPQPDAPTPQPIEEFAKMFKEPNFLPDAQFIAVDGEEWVGLSTLWKDSVRSDRLWVGLTGVLRSHRRRSIATALKLLTFKYAQAHGARYIQTENEENNPMYQLNVKLGFKPKPGWVSYRRDL